jgi:multidrug efflux pump subunit AcrA (membrane-fusion protein)
MEHTMTNAFRLQHFRGMSGAGAAILLGAFGLAGCGEGQAESAPTVTTAEVVRSDLQITAEATGQLEPLRTIEVKSKASGEVREVLVDTGDRVEVGTLLVTIDARDVQNDYDQSQADYEVAQERLNISEAQLRRSEELLRRGSSRPRSTRGGTWTSPTPGRRWSGPRPTWSSPASVFRT